MEIKGTVFPEFYTEQVFCFICEELELWNNNRFSLETIDMYGLPVFFLCPKCESNLAKTKGLEFEEDDQIAKALPAT